MNINISSTIQVIQSRGLVAPLYDKAVYYAPELIIKSTQLTVNEVANYAKSIVVANNLIQALDKYTGSEVNIFSDAEIEMLVEDIVKND